MGFFSDICKRPACGHPLLSPMAVTAGVNEWMSEGVSLSSRGNIHTGTYDGYGRLDGAEEAVGHGAAVWHRACWELEGKPTVFPGPSEGADDQGWFFDDGAHDAPDPRRTTPTPTPA